MKKQECVDKYEAEWGLKDRTALQNAQYKDMSDAASTAEEYIQAKGLKKLRLKWRLRRLTDRYVYRGYVLSDTLGQQQAKGFFALRHRWAVGKTIRETLRLARRG